MWIWKSSYLLNQYVFAKFVVQERQSFPSNRSYSLQIQVKIFRCHCNKRSTYLWTNITFVCFLLILRAPIRRLGIPSNNTCCHKHIKPELPPSAEFYLLLTWNYRLRILSRYFTLVVKKIKGMPRQRYAKGYKRHFIA